MKPIFSESASATPAGAKATDQRLWNREYVKVMVCNFMLFFAFYLLTPLLPIYLDEQFNADSMSVSVKNMPSSLMPTRIFWVSCCRVMWQPL